MKTEFEKFEQNIKRLKYESRINPYAMGYDAGKNGSNTTNTHFSIFSTNEKTKEWERGKAAAEKDKIKPKT